MNNNLTIKISVINKSIKLSFLIVFVFCTICSYASLVQSATLKVHLVNGVTGHSVAGAKIIAREVLGHDMFKWAASGKTDSRGLLVFDLKGLGQGKVYRLETRPYYGRTVYSRKITKPGSIKLRVGNLMVKAVNGADNSLLRNTKIVVRERLSSGKYKWTTSGFTDQHGIIGFDLEGLGHGKVYRLYANSPSDGSIKFSIDIKRARWFTFRVGNKPLKVKLVNGLSGKGIAKQKISAYEVLKDGKRVWKTKRYTDTKGWAVFDLEGLGKGSKYVFVSTPYNEVVVFSKVVTKPGSLIFYAGSVEAKVISGKDGAILKGYKVSAAECLANGKYKWRASGKTDNKGIIRFDFPDLRNGKEFVLYAKSLSDGSTKYSKHIKRPGRLTFVVGNKPLRVRLINGLSGKGLSNKKIYAYEILKNSKRIRKAERSTNANGWAVFDLEGLGKGKEYILLSKPYKIPVYTNPITRPGDFVFKVGLLPVRLIDEDKNVPLTGKKLMIYEKTPDGKLHWKQQGITDDNGVVVFDVPGLEEDRVFVLKTRNIYGEGKNYYSRWITKKGKVLFKVKRGYGYIPDLKTPTVKIDTPINKAHVSHGGFIIMGRALDNVAVDHVVVILKQNKRSITKTAKYDPISKYWKVWIGPELLSPGIPLSISVKAVDKAYNGTNSSIQLYVIKDNKPPVLTITSHKNGDKVSKFGFLVSGNARDNCEPTQLKATLIDPIKGKSINNTRVQISRNGKWTLVVPRGKSSPNRKIRINFELSDSAGNVSKKTLTLNVHKSLVNPFHLIQRITFGASVDMLKEIESIGPDAFLERQMHPESINDMIVSSVSRIWHPEKMWEMTAYQLLYSGYSNRQLQEMMTWFWENHFNTNVRTHGHIEYELEENRLFRENAFGKFKDLLIISATSPAMLRYLDNVSNRKQAPNENYAREIMELHTLGVDGGYTQQDIVEVARAFTGWRIKDGKFFFDRWRHDYGAKRVLGHMLPAGQGVEDGYQVIDILASHPSTSKFICKKLLKFFVVDEPAHATIERCARVFRNSRGDMRKVLTWIFHSSEFNSKSAYHAKVKTPLEFVAGMLRNLPISPVEWHLRKALDAMDMRPFYYPLPTGWPETGDKWINSNQMMQRMLFANGVVLNPGNTRYCGVNIKEFLKRLGYETSEGIVGALFEILLANDFTKMEWDIATGILTYDHRVPFDIESEEADGMLRDLLGFILSLPTYQLQ